MTLWAFVMITNFYVPFFGFFLFFVFFFFIVSFDLLFPSFGFYVMNYCAFLDSDSHSGSSREDKQENPDHLWRTYARNRSGNNS